jgi:hypothetical protein
MNRFVHSLVLDSPNHLDWKTGLTRQEEQAWLMAFSIACAHRIGGTIALHTTEELKPVVEHLGYDEIFYDIVIDPKVPMKYFAYYKIGAYRNEPLNAIFIDTDVFIMSDQYNDILGNIDENSIICQNLYDSYWNEPAMEAVDRICTIRGLRKDVLMRENNTNCLCGVVKFNEQSFKDEYVSISTDMLRTYAALDSFNPYGLVFCEEYWLHYLASQRQKNIITLLDDNETRHMDLSDKTATLKHPQSLMKFKQLSHIKALFQEFDENEFNRITELTRNYRKTSNI